MVSIDTEIISEIYTGWSSGLAVDEGLIEVIIVHGIFTLLFVDADIVESSSDAAAKDDDTDNDSDGDSGASSWSSFLIGKFALSSELNVCSISPWIVFRSAETSSHIVRFIFISFGNRVFGIAIS